MLRTHRRSIRRLWARRGQLPKVKPKNPYCHMKKTDFVRWHAIPAFAMLAVLPVRGQAQTAENPRVQPDPTDAGKQDDDEIVMMSPFVVNSDRDIGYVATSTLAGTRLNTSLGDVGSAISVVTQQFLKDTGSKNSQDLLVYTTNTEVSGIGGNFAGTGNGQTVSEPDQASPQTNTRVRGLTSADNTRDYFLTDIPWDSYNVERVDMQRGPNGILFGLGSPAGIINSTTRTAVFKNQGQLDVGFGRYGSARLMLDANYVILPGELALRVEGLRDNTQYRQNPAYNLDKRFYSALRYEPIFLNRGSAHTTLTVNYEAGDIQANRPRILPPGDRITPWFSFGKATYDPFNSWVVDSADPAHSGQHLAAASSYNPWLGDFGNGQVLSGIYYTNEAGSTTLSGARTGEVDTVYGRASSGSIDQTIDGIQFNRLSGIVGYSTYATRAGLKYADLGQYKDTYITDSSIFNYWDNLISGPNAHQWEGFNVVNANLSQTFFDNRVGIEAVYDRQHYRNGEINGGAYNIEIDLNKNLSDGTPNPNVGRPYPTVNTSYGNNSYVSTRTNWRVTSYGELNFRDFMESSWLTSFLGRHIFTGVVSSNRKDTENLSWTRWVADAAYGTNYANTSLMTSSARGVSIVSYLGGSLLNADSASGANLSSVGAKLSLPGSDSVKLWDSHWNSTTANYGDAWTTVRSHFSQKPGGGASTQSENPDNYVGWTNASYSLLNADEGDLSSLYTAAHKSRSDVTTKALVWQGFFLDDVVVGTVGVRKDTAKSYSVYASKNSDNSVNIAGTDYVLSSEPDNTVKGDSTTWSVVVHTPHFIQKWLPAGINVSAFYNHSSNFQPEANRVDVYGNPLGAPTGKTKDYGFLVSALDNRLNFKINWYHTTVYNASLTDALPSIYMIGYTENWGYIFSKINKESYGPSWQWDYASNPLSGQTSAQSDAQKVAATNAWLANLPSDAFYKAWHIDLGDTYWQNRQSTYVTPTGLAVTGDTDSKGVEYEVTARLTDNWDLTINASHDTARRVNLGGSIAEWVNERNAVYQGDAGLIRYWWAGSSDTIRSVWNAQFLSQWKLLLLQQNTDVPELRPWHLNIVTNYRFSDIPALKGFNVGGGWRWQDKVVIGYPVIEGAGGDETFDLGHPYYGPSESNIDLWVGYEHKVTDKINWRIQLNVRNAFAKKELIPISAQPDGTPAAYRIPELMTWYVTNTFTF